MGHDGGYDRLERARRELPPPRAGGDADARRRGGSARTRAVLRRARTVPPRRRARARRVAPAADPALPQAGDAGSARSGSADLGRPRGLRDRRPRAAHRAARPRRPSPAARAGRATHGAGARPRPAVVGALVRGGGGPRRTRRADPQVAPHPHRRHLRCRHRDRPPRFQPGGDRAPARRLGAGTAARAESARHRQPARARHPTRRARRRRAPSRRRPPRRRWRVRPTSAAPSARWSTVRSSRLVCR